MSDALPTSRVAITAFGPQALMRWLLDATAKGGDGLGDGSKLALSRLIVDAKSGLAVGNDDLYPAVLCLRYDDIIGSLSDGDLLKFAQSCIDDQYDRKEPDSLSYFRRELTRAFSEDRICPDSGPRSLAKRAVEAATRALHAAPLASATTRTPTREAAIRDLISGLDEALLYSERLVDCLLEFHAVALKKLGASVEAMKAQVADGDVSGQESKDWSTMDWSKVSWGSKLFKLKALATMMVDWLNSDSNPNYLDKPWLRNLADECWSPCSMRANVRHVLIADEKTGGLLRVLALLCDMRNSVHHSPGGMVDVDSAPIDYRKTARLVWEQASLLRGMIEHSPWCPLLARVTRVSRDFADCWEFTLVGDDRRTIVAKYFGRQEYRDRTMFEDDREPFDITAFGQSDVMFWVIPSPSVTEDSVVHPLALRRIAIGMPGSVPLLEADASGDDVSSATESPTQLAGPTPFVEV